MRPFTVFRYELGKQIWILYDLWFGACKTISRNFSCRYYGIFQADITEYFKTSSEIRTWYYTAFVGKCANCHVHLQIELHPHFQGGKSLIGELWDIWEGGEGITNIDSGKICFFCWEYFLNISVKYICDQHTWHDSICSLLINTCWICSMYLK